MTDNPLAQISDVAAPEDRIARVERRAPLYLCPSDRSARAWQRRLLAHGESVVDCVAVEPWLTGLWSRAQLFGAIEDKRELIDPVALNALWHRIVADMTTLAEPECTRVAGLADEAWTLAFRHGFPMQQIAAFAGGDDNVSLFAVCATRMQRLLQERGALTRAELPEALLTHCRTLVSMLPARIVLTPSFSADPALLRLWKSCRELGVEIDAASADETSGMAPPAPDVVCCADSAQEMAAALDWAEHKLASSPDITVALIVPDLATHRADWLRSLRSRFNADAWWRDPATDRERFNLSVADTLDLVPHVASLLTLLRSCTTEQDTEVLAQALRHSRWGRSPESLHDISLRQQDLLDRGIDRSTIADWKDVRALTASSALASTLAQRENSHTVSRSAHRAHVHALVNALTESTWLARTDLFQADETWSTTLDRWERFDDWLPPVHWSGALGELTRLAGQTPFQPKAGAARLQVMGLLESAGVPLDAARIVGLHDRVLPERLKPHPMLPRGWQIDQRVGLGSVDEVDARGKRLWQNWLALCGTLSISFANDDEGTALRLTPLAQHLPARKYESDNDLPDTAAQRVTPNLTTNVDEQLPARDTSPGSKPISARTLEDQAQCPRRAGAARLGLKEWPEHAVGIPARVRGTLVHAVLAAVGAARLRAHETGASVPSDEALLHIARQALDTCIAEQAALRLRVAQMVWGVERSRVMALVDKVLRLEQTRAGFAVVAVESETKARLLDQDFRLRVDRVDRSVNGSEGGEFRVVFDYKTGKVARGDWYAEGTSGRLAAPQLPLYALILSQDQTDAPVRALGYVVVGDDEEPKFVGVGEDKALTSSRAAKNAPSWDTLASAWHDQLGVLVSEVQRGVAEVAPLKGRSTCRNCAFGSFCREPWSLASESGDAADVDAQDGEISND